MSFVVAFDGQPLSAAALARATEYAAAMDEDVVAVTVIPDNDEYARERGWIREGEPFGIDRVVDRLREQVHGVAPDATFEYETTDPYAPPGTIATRIRRVATSLDAEVVFVGSEHAGGFVAPVSSVGGAVSSGDEYDVYLVRHPIDDQADEEDED